MLFDWPWAMHQSVAVRHRLLIAVQLNFNERTDTAQIEIANRLTFIMEQGARPGLTMPASDIAKLADDSPHGRWRSVDHAGLRHLQRRPS